MDLVLDALTDTGKLLPLLAIVYFIVSFLEYRYDDRMKHFMVHIGSLGPVAGALLGCVPQCGFSVIASALYVKRFISTGTLLAVFLSTSDEAIPVLLSMPEKLSAVGLLIAIKVVIAIIAGVAIDAIVKPRLPVVELDGICVHGALGEEANGHPGCCAHGLSGTQSKINALLVHPLLHTAKIFLFLLVLSILFNFIVSRIGEARLAPLLLNGTAFQPCIAALIGLIPSCFTSVLLAELFAKGVLSFGSLVAGLCAASGLGILVLIKENKDLKNTLFVIGSLVAVSITAGIIIQLIR